MKEYKRLTKEDLCYSEWVRNGNSPSELYYVLKDLEDKIENGELVEIPSLISYNEHLKKYEVLSYDIEIYVEEYCKTKAEAEKKLKE